MFEGVHTGGAHRGCKGGGQRRTAAGRGHAEGEGHPHIGRGEPLADPHTEEVGEAAQGAGGGGGGG
eukprot:646806-Prorocentrum_minimum.AAC.1